MLIKIICLIFLVIALCVLTIYRERLRYAKLFFIGLAVFYFAILLWFTIFRHKIDQAANSLIPLYSFWKIIQVRWYGNGEYIFGATVGNLVLFIPIGMLVSNAKVRNSFVFSGILGLLISSVIELTQYTMALGVFETDDIIFNTWGALIGCSFAALISSKSTAKSDRIIRSGMPLIVFALLMFLICAVLLIKYIIFFISTF